MLILRNSPNSPFGRKVVVAINLLGMESKVSTQPADTTSVLDTLRKENPLGKIPTLITEGGQALYDSRVIVEFLNDLDGRHLLIPQGAQKMEVLRQQAVADGIMDAAILKVYEVRFRPAELHVPAWLEHQQGKIDRALDAAQSQAASNQETIGPMPHIGQITLACALGYLDFRFAKQWRENRPALVQWFEDFHTSCPSFAASAPKA
jgi:glutathione S-transferase